MPEKPQQQLKLTRREMSRLLGAGLLGGVLPASAHAQENAAQVPQPAQPRIIPADELLAAPAVEIARAIRDGAVTSQELTLAYLQRIEAINPGLNAIVHVNAARAMEAAQRADAARAGGTATGPLHGVPMTLKDSIDTAGVQTTWGTLGRSQFVPQRDATVASRLQAAGAVLLGKTNTPEFTLSFETDNLVFGRTKNPFDPARSPGGSSGGAAAAVTTALCAFDIGSDTGGSIRVPSHCCGTAGLKPTQGRVPRTGHAVSFGGIHDPLIIHWPEAIESKGELRDQPGHIIDLLVSFAATVEPAFDDLNSIEVCADRIPQSIDHEGRRLACWCRRQITAHGHAFLVAAKRRRTAAQIIVGIFPSAEKANHDPRTARGVGFLALHGVKDRLAGILGGPNRLVTRCGQFITFDSAEIRLDEWMLCASFRRFGRYCLAEEVVLFRGRQAGVAVSRPDQAKLIGVFAELFLQGEAVFQRFTRVLPLQHIWLFQLCEIQIAGIQRFEISELIIG